MPFSSRVWKNPDLRAMPQGEGVKVREDQSLKDRLHYGSGPGFFHLRGRSLDLLVELVSCGRCGSVDVPAEPHRSNKQTLRRVVVAMALLLLIGLIILAGLVQ
jgi:hypothetical protein